jgi:protein-disulfide isomerase
VSDRDHRQGALDAPVLLLEYGDYGCLRCGQMYLVLQALQREVKQPFCFVFRHFPLLVLRPLAGYAAELAEAAAAQGYFWPMHDYLFQHQQSLGNGQLLAFALALGLEVDRFEREVAEHRYADHIQTDLQSGISSGVNVKPTFFISGIRYNDECSVRDLMAAIEVQSHCQ